jgi:hypothetical protein
MHCSCCARAAAAVVVTMLFTACDNANVGPTMPGAVSGRDAALGRSTPPWGPETPHFNLEVILRGEGFGVVKFRQPNDDALVINLDTRLRGLTPNTSYVLQRAVDTNVDDVCTSAGWLTLGTGLQPQSIMTDDTGTGSEQLFRSVAAFPVGAEFDVHFRVLEEATSAVVLTSECYQFTISR